jgi:indoleamine 2,3-dioxygenase
MIWHLHERGFLPLHDPARRLDDPAFADIERLGADLPQLTQARTFRDKCGSYLAKTIDWDEVFATKTDSEIERAFKLFSYFASAYIHAPGLPTVARIPAAIAGPIVRLGQHLDRPPILAYASYCLHNWRRIDPAGPVALGNISLLQNFSMAGDGKTDEDWFILVHVDIEARAGGALNAMRDAARPIAERLEATAASLHAMNQTLNRMPEQCSPDVYFRKVRPYIFGFNDIVYEGCFKETPQTYRGETGAQSSIIPTMLMALGLTHKDSLLTRHLEDMRKYMPAPHREFIRTQTCVRDEVLRLAPTTPRVKTAYNDCVREVIAFRSKHFEYAVNYIEKKVDNPIATGGTPYIPWLRQLIEETKSYYLS